MPRFAVLRHDSPRGLHFDLLLQMGDVLRTWALPQLPQPGVEMTCEALPDHRLAYLDYEGALRGDRGSVTCWDRGTFQTQQQSDSQLVAELAGEKIAGRVVLEALPDDAVHWRFTWFSD